MELRAYWSIIWRRIWVIALVVGIVALYVGYQYYYLRKTPGALKTYQSSVAFQVGLESTTKATDQNYGDYTTTAETLADTLIASPNPILSSKEFDMQVIQQISTDMSVIKQRYGANADLGPWNNAGSIGQSLAGGRTHTIVTINVTWPTAAGAWAIAQAVGEVSVAHIGTYLDYVVTNDPTHKSADPKYVQPAVTARLISAATAPGLTNGPDANKPTLLLVLLFVALIIGIALAFLIEYLDDRIRRKEDVVQLLQLPIYGEVPRIPALGQGKK